MLRNVEWKRRQREISFHPLRSVDQGQIYHGKKGKLTQRAQADLLLFNGLGGEQGQNTVSLDSRAVLLTYLR